VKLTTRCQKASETVLFQNFFTGVILFAGLLVGIGTYPEMEASYGPVLGILDFLVIGLFTVEVIVRIGASGGSPRKYFGDSWNIFDFTIVSLSIVFLLPIFTGGDFIPVIRLVRLLRVLRVLRAFPQLQFLVGILMRSMTYMGWIGVLLFLILFIYGVAGVVFFEKYDPENFGTLHDSMFTLTGMVTLDGWTPIFHDLRRQTLIAIPYFLSFVAVGALLMVNLVIGVIMKVMEEDKQKVISGSTEEKIAKICPLWYRENSSGRDKA